MAYLDPTLYIFLNTSALSVYYDQIEWRELNIRIWRPIIDATPYISVWFLFLLTAV